MAAAEWDVIGEDRDQWSIANESLDVTPGVAGVSARISAAQLAADRRSMTHPESRPATAAWSDVLAAVPGEVKAFAANLIAGAKLRELEEMRAAGIDTPSLREAIAREKAIVDEVRKSREEMVVPDTTALQRGVQQGLVSLPVAAPALAAGVLTRNPAIAAASMYPVTAAETYGQLRAEGVEPGLAGKHAAFQGFVESGTELLPFVQLLARLPAGQQVLRVIFAELPGESAAQLLQGASDYVAREQAAGKELTSELAMQGIREASRALPETAIATLVASGAQVGAIRGIDAAAARGKRDEPAPGLPPEAFIAPEGWQITSEKPVQAAAEQSAVPQSEVQAPSEVPVEVPAAAGFEVVDESPFRDINEPLPPDQLAALRERLATNEDVRAEFAKLKNEAGWLEEGGKRLGTAEAHFEGRVTGRTLWLPRADWWPGRPGQYNEQQVRGIIDKALAGEKLGPKQQELVDYLAEIAYQKVRSRVPIEVGESTEPDNVYFAKTPDLLGQDISQQAALNKRNLVSADPRVPVFEVAGDPQIIKLADLRVTLEEIDRLRATEKGKRVAALEWDDLNRARARVAEEFFDELSPRAQATLLRRPAAADFETGEFHRIGAPSEIGGGGGMNIHGAHMFDIAEEIENIESALLQRSTEQVLDQPGMREAVQQDTLRNRERILKGETGEDVEASRIQGQAGATYAPLFQSIGIPAQPPAGRSLTLGARGQAQRTVAIPDKPINREVAVDLIQRAFGMKIYQGKPFKGKMLGFFRPKTGEVRIKKHNDLEVAAHEFFHWLDRAYGSIRALYHRREFNDELRGVSYDAKKLFEGFAEFGRLYMTQEVEAAMRAPKFYDAFVQEAARLGILDKLNVAQQVMHTWYQQGAEQRALSKIGKPEYPLEARFEHLTHRIVDRAIARGADYLQAAKVIEREIAGDIQDATVSPYKSLRLLAANRTIAGQIVNVNTLKWEGGDLVPTGPGLLQVFEPVADVMPETIGYFVGRRAQELKKFGKERLLDDDEIRALLALPDKIGRRADIEKAFREYQKFTQRLLDFAENSGILNRKTRAYWQSIYENYVPFMRVSEQLGSPDVERIGGVFKKLRGGTRNLNDILENMVSNAEGIVRASLRNVAKRQLYDLIESGRLGQKYAVRVPEGVKPVMIGTSQIANWLKSIEAKLAGEAEEGSVYQEVAKALEVINSIQTIDNKSILEDVEAQATFFIGHQQPGILDKDFYLRDGKPVWFQIGDPLLWDMVVELNTIKPLNFVEEMLSLSKRTLTRGVVASPTFQLRNLVRDTFNALTLGKNFRYPILDTMTSLAKVYTNSPEFQDFLNNGGGFGFAIHSDIRKVKLKLERVKHLGKIDTKALIDTPDRMLEAYDTVMQASELANRLAEFRRAKQAGVSSREAAFRGREIGTDFGMRGNAPLYRYFAMSVPFGSARLQGLYRLERELLEHKGKQTPKALVHAVAVKYAAKSLLWITLPSLALYLMNKDKEWYQEQNDATRDLYWLFPTEDGRVIKVPKPFETGMLFGTMAERLWQYAETKNDRELIKAAEFLIIQTFSMEGLPQIVRPVYDLAMNENYRGAPIIPEYLKDVAPEEQFTPYTSQAIIATARKFGVSPIKLEYLLRGYFGYLGGHAIFAADALISPKTGGVPPERDISQYPVLEGFLQASPTRSTEQEQTFYELAGKVNEVVATVRKQKADARADDLAAYLGDSEQAQYFALQQGIDQIKTQVNLITAEMRRIRFHPTMTATEKRGKIAMLQLEKNKLFREAVKGIGTSDIEELRDYLEWKP